MTTLLDNSRSNDDEMTAPVNNVVLAISNDGQCKMLATLPAVPPSSKPVEIVITSPAVVKPSVPHSVSSGDTTETASLLSGLSSESDTAAEAEAAAAAAIGNDPFRCKDWCGKKHYADFIREGLEYQDRPADNVIMLFESPSTCTDQTSFYNNNVFPVHDYPPAAPMSKTVLAPLRYSVMNGATYPSFLHDVPPAGLLEHWARYVPGFERPSFVSELDDDAIVYAYLPLEHVRQHLNDPHVHYHLAGKGAIHLMTEDTTEQYSNTADVRPCVAKVTHSMGSKGIFIIRNDSDEQLFRDFLSVSGNPSFVVTEMVDIHRNLSCHFFIHPNGEMTWIGSSENHKDVRGNWSIDSIIELYAQEELKAMQLPYARQVADYCLSLGFWGFCGIDILFNADGKGYIVDVNPRTTGTSPALMLARRLEEECGFQAGIMRRSSKYAFRGSAKSLVEQIDAVNEEGEVRIVLLSFCEVSPEQTFMNISVHGETLDRCRAMIDRFALPVPGK